LRQGVELLKTLTEEVRSTEKWLHQATRSDRRVEILRTIPGLGELLATVVALEMDRVERFENPAKLAAYAGLVPTSYSSGGHTFHGKRMPQSNKWLRWALVEAAWIAIRLDPYFRSHFAKHVLKENRPYQSQPPTSSNGSLQASWAAFATA
jgi:transposase